MLQLRNLFPAHFVVFSCDSYIFCDPDSRSRSTLYIYHLVPDPFGLHRMDFSKRQRPRAIPLIDQVYNHLVLPLQLPHREDPSLPDVEDAILARLIQSAKCLADASDHDDFRSA